MEIKIKKLKNKNGFAILFAVTLSAILLAIALGVANIALKEVKFSTSARATNEAFFAADTVTELMLYNDKNPATYPAPASGSVQTWPTVVVSGLGNQGTSCAVATITKDYSNGQNLKTTIISKGYDTGSGSGSCTPSSNSVEREIDTYY